MRRARITMDAALDDEVSSGGTPLAPDHTEPESSAHRSRPFGDLVPAGLSIALGGAALIFSEGLSDGVGEVPGASFWPTILGWSLIGLGALLAITVWMPRRMHLDAPDSINRGGLLRLVLTTVLLISYLSLWGVLPFWITTLGTTVALMALFGMRGWKALVLFPVIVVTIIQLLFIVALRMPL